MDTFSSLGHRTGEFTLQVYMKQKPEIHEGVRQYLEKSVNDIEGYMAFLDSFIGGTLE